MIENYRKNTEHKLMQDKKPPTLTADPSLVFSISNGDLLALMVSVIMIFYFIFFC